MRFAREACQGASLWTRIPMMNVQHSSRPPAPRRRGTLLVGNLTKLSVVQSNTVYPEHKQDDWDTTEHCQNPAKPSRSPVSRERSPGRRDPKKDNGFDKAQNHQKVVKCDPVAQQQSSMCRRNASAFDLTDQNAIAKVVNILDKGPRACSLASKPLRAQVLRLQAVFHVPVDCS